VNYLLRLALNHNPDVYLLSSWDYRREPLAPSSSPLLVLPWELAQTL
jgi:hypothetical protein